MKGLAQANILRSNNTTETGYGIVYANEISGHRNVPNLTALYALYDWQLSASGDNSNNDAIGQLWYVINADGNGTGYLYQLTDWSNRHNANGWVKFTTSGDTPDLSKYATKDYVSEALEPYVQDVNLLEMSDTDIEIIFNS